MNKKIQEAEKLKEKIIQLEESEMQSIYQILEKNKANITINMNGIYFDILSLKPDIFKTIEKFVDHCLSRKNLLK